MGVGPKLARFRFGSEELAVVSYPKLSADVVDGLTPSEIEVLERILAGDSNAEIAGRRGTSVRTVAKQVAAIFEKVGVSSRRELAARLAAANGE
jgi:DNA-binding CsgD family transcriptional regulator